MLSFRIIYAIVKKHNQLEEKMVGVEKKEID